MWKRTLRQVITNDGETASSWTSWAERQAMLGIWQRPGDLLGVLSAGDRGGARAAGKRQSNTGRVPRQHHEGCHSVIGRLVERIVELYVAENRRKVLEMIAQDVVEEHADSPYVFSRPTSFATGSKVTIDGEEYPVKLEVELNESRFNEEKNGVCDLCGQNCGTYREKRRHRRRIHGQEIRVV